MTNIANYFDKSYFDGLKYLKKNSDIIGYDTVVLSGYLSKRYVEKLGWNLQANYKNKKLQYHYITLPHGGKVRFNFKPKSIEYVNYQTGEVKYKPMHFADINFSIGGLLFNDNYYLGSHVLLNKCYRILNNILDIDLSVQFKIKRIDIAANFPIEGYTSKAISKYINLPKYWRGDKEVYNVNSVYFFASRINKKSQKVIHTYKKKNGVQRIELRLFNLPRKINSTPFSQVFKSSLQIDRAAYLLEDYVSGNNPSGWDIYHNAIRLYVKVIDQMIRVNEYDRRFKKEKIFKCRDQIYINLYKLWKNTQRHLSIGSMNSVNPPVARRGYYKGATMLTQNPHNSTDYQQLTFNPKIP